MEISYTMSIITIQYIFLKRSTYFFYLLISIILFNQRAFSQHLSYSDILNLYKSNAETNESFLHKKGFTFSVSKKDEETKSTSITWMYKRAGSNSNSSNEYIIKDCSNLFQGNCEQITYMTASEEHINALKNDMKANFYKLLYSDTNENGVLSHYYLIPAAGLPGPTEVCFKSIPKSDELQTKIYIFQIRKINIEVKNGN